MPRRYHDEAWLREKYCREGVTQREIAEECGVSPRTIRTHMDRFEIETRDIEGENHPLSGMERDEETKQQISESLSGRTLSEEWRERIAAAHEGTSLPDAVKERMAEPLTGIRRSEETRRKMRSVSRWGRTTWHRVTTEAPKDRLYYWEGPIPECARLV